MRKKDPHKGAGITFAAVLILLIAYLSLNGTFFQFGDYSWDTVFDGLGLSDSARVSSPKDGITLHFLDVGQGDSELIVTKEKVVLIDSGERENYPRIVNYLASNNIKKIDYIITTHPHSDHIGGFGYIIGAVPVDNIIMPDIPDELLPTTNAFTKMLEAVADNNVNVVFAEADAVYDLGGGASMTVFAPKKVYSDLNNFSLLVRLTHGENSFLFTGDMEKEAEEAVLAGGGDISANVLKIAHHGSNTSSTKAFLTAVNPRYAVIEVGADNSYAHPTESTLKRLANIDLVVLRTDLNGNIVFFSNGISEDLHYQTQKE